MSRAPAVGKVSTELFRRVILRHLGRPDPDVLVPPRHGVDVGVVRTAPGQVLVLTSDPVFVVPAYGWRRAAWFAVHILASDVAMSGLPPRWMSVDLNLPRALSDDDLAALWVAYAEACEQLGIAVVAGHTGRYDGCAWPMVGGATCLATGPRDGYVTTAMARPGDRVVVTKGPAIEATALFAASFPERIRAAVGTDLWRAADALFEAMTVVPEARVAAGVGLRGDGVSAMHDATEGGLLGGLCELADAAGVGLRIDVDAVPLPPEVRAVCGHVGMNPYAAISEGTLIATVGRREDELLDALRAEGIPAATIGEVTPAADGRIVACCGEQRPLRHPGLDPFWDAFSAWSAAAG